MPSQFRRVLITGCGGMLGNAVYPHFRAHFAHVVATDKLLSEPWLQPLDVRDVARMRDVFEEVQPDLVLHLAAETDLEFCQFHPDTAEAVNSTATAAVAEQVEARGATLVYISTAGVFDGTKLGPYVEVDEPNPIMVYGMTKLGGERHVQKLCTRHYVIRAGWMVGGGGAKDHKFVRKILRQIEEKDRKQIHAVDDKWGTPTYTLDFAVNLGLLLEQNAYGVYHMVCEGSGTRFDVAREIVRLCDRDDIDVVPVDSMFFKNEYPAPRPRSEMLQNAKLMKAGINRMRHWRDALRAYLQSEYPGLCTPGR